MKKTDNNDAMTMTMAQTMRLRVRTISSTDIGEWIGEVRRLGGGGWSVSSTKNASPVDPNFMLNGASSPLTDTVICGERGPTEGDGVST